MPLNSTDVEQQKPHHKTTKPPKPRDPLLRNENQAPPSARAGATTRRTDLNKTNSNETLNESVSSGLFSWVVFSRIVTCCFFPLILYWKRNHTMDNQAIQAWREKVTLCIIIALLMLSIAFLTFGLTPSLCPVTGDKSSSFPFYNSTSKIPIMYQDSIIVHGLRYDFDQTREKLLEHNVNLTTDWYGADITGLFNPDHCSEFFIDPMTFTCQVSNSASLSLVSANCLDVSLLNSVKMKGRIYFSWEQIGRSYDSYSDLIVFNKFVLNMTSFISSSPSTTFNQLSFNNPQTILKVSNQSDDTTRSFYTDPQLIHVSKCLTQLYTVGQIDSQSIGCVASNVILVMCLVAIVCVILVKFLMALTFHWFLSRRLVLKRESTPYTFHLPSSVDKSAIIMLVTCYSEGEHGIKSTLDSLATTNYPDDRKLLFVVADGIITGTGNKQSTPEIILNMMTFDHNQSHNEACSYFAIADGAKQHNMAKVYAGYYITPTHKVPMITIIKTGTPHEYKTSKKPGNRGKRDSQLILMNFLSRVMFDDRMTRLDYEIFWKIKSLTNSTADIYELLLMVDADTVVDVDSVIYMELSMRNDKNIMGLCGETRIGNKWGNWVTAIQVFEYYISHHLGKSFESVFGGVTCLPGCFCMYRIKGRKQNWIVPILASPDIVEEYSENVVDTLHKKNLLLLGEDRFLTTLMLKTFPKRKMMFVPQAKCETVCPDEFKVLLSQRRRWINSTIHNLLELVRLRELCGIFCFSMQFVIFLELIGTVVLPAAIFFTMILIFSAIITGAPAVIPLFLLAATLGVPGVLIVITSSDYHYIGWMIIYLLALPIWNFILPVYAFWNFDDFSWGETRKVDGEIAGNGGHGSGDGGFDRNVILLKKWIDWETERRKQQGIQQVTPEEYLQSMAKVKGYPKEAIEALSDHTARAINITEIQNLIGPELTTRFFDYESDHHLLPPPSVAASINEAEKGSKMAFSETASSSYYYSSPSHVLAYNDESLFEEWGGDVVCARPKGFSDTTISVVNLLETKKDLKHDSIIQQQKRHNGSGIANKYVQPESNIPTFTITEPTLQKETSPQSLKSKKSVPGTLARTFGATRQSNSIRLEDVFGKTVTKEDKMENIEPIQNPTKSRKEDVLKMDTKLSDTVLDGLDEYNFEHGDNSYSFTTAISSIIGFEDSVMSIDVEDVDGRVVEVEKKDGMRRNLFGPREKKF